MNKNHNYLVHYGVKGQKWGVRQYQNLDGSLTPLGREHYGVGQGRKKTKSIEDAKKDGLAAVGMFIGIKLALVAATAGVIAIGAKLANNSAKKFNKRLHEEIESDPIDKKTGLHLKSREYTRDEDIKAVNPRFREWSSKDSGANNNCMLCTMTYDLRRRGYNVTAGMAREGFRDSDTLRWYPEAKVVSLKKPNSTFNYSVKDVQPMLDSQGVGARGNLMFAWIVGGGHSVAYEVEADGKAHIYDTQANKKYDSLEDYNKQCAARLTGGTFDPIIPTSYARLDNVEPDPKHIKELVSMDVESNSINNPI